MNRFLDSRGWRIVEPVGEDSSPRRYSRIEKNGRTAIFMDGSGGQVPGHSIVDFIRIGKWLREIGLRAPEVLDTDGEMLIVEDFGNMSFKAALDKGEDAQTLYALGAEVLVHLRKMSCPLSLPDYKTSHVHKGLRRFVDWYVPSVRKEKNPDGFVESYLEVWGGIESRLPPRGEGFLHIDFHVENLMWMPQEQGIRRCGILDFQGAMRGPQAYDLANFLEDARYDVPEAIRQKILGAQGEDEKSWYRVLGTQFHARVIGQFIKLAVNGKPQYLKHLPRLTHYIAQALENPLLKDLKSWLAHEKIILDPDIKIDPQNVKAFIRPDAF